MSGGRAPTWAVSAWERSQRGPSPARTGTDLAAPGAAPSMAPIHLSPLLQSPPPDAGGKGPDVIQLNTFVPALPGFEPETPTDPEGAGTAAEGGSLPGADGAPSFAPWGDPAGRLGPLSLGLPAFAYAAPGGGGGGGAVLPSPVTKSDLLKEMKGGFIDVNNLSAPLKQVLADAGSSPAALAKLADKHGLVSPEKLFAFIDGFDHNGKGSSFDVATPDAAGSPMPTTAGKLYEALKQETAANREVAREGLDAKAFTALADRHAVLDLNHLGANVAKALGGAVSRADLEAVAGADGQIKGRREFGQLHALLDRADGRADGIASARHKGADGQVADSAGAGALRAIRDDITANLGLAQYAAPGKAAALQPALTVAADAMKVGPKDQKPVDLKMKGVDQFTLYPDDAAKGGKACFEAAVKACTDHNRQQHGDAAPKLDSPDQAIQIAYAEDAEGRVAIDQTQARLGREYIDKALDAGYPAVIGVSYADESYNADRMTDHFVTVDRRGYDDQNRLFYEFKDPGAGGRVGRLYVDEDTGKLFKEGDHKGRYVQNADYEVTQVRTYQGV